MNKRVLALDIGSVRIGIAMTDELCVIVSPYETYIRKNFDTDLRYVAGLVKENNVGLVICGLPVSMDGNENAQTEYTKGFAERLKGLIEVPLKYQDERLSTIAAEDVLLKAKMRRDKRKNNIDKIAAAIILESYLNKTSS